jgi:hypothetical protein
MFYSLEKIVVAQDKFDNGESLILPTKVESKSVESKKIERKISKTKCRNMKMSKYKSIEV